jgi:hypothetical protein
MVNETTAPYRQKGFDGMTDSTTFGEPAMILGRLVRTYCWLSLDRSYSEEFLSGVAAEAEADAVNFREGDVGHWDATCYTIRKSSDGSAYVAGIGENWQQSQRAGEDIQKLARQTAGERA